MSEYRSIWKCLYRPPHKLDWVDVERVRTRYLEAGPAKAPTVLLLHGSSGSLEYFCANIAEYAKHFHVLAVDMMGSGWTDRPDRPDYPYTPDAYRDHVRGFMDAMGAVRQPGRRVGASWHRGGHSRRPHLGAFRAGPALPRGQHPVPAVPGLPMNRGRLLSEVSTPISPFINVNQETSMSKQLLSLAIATVLTSSALAQSSVTLYGVADAGLATVSNKAGKRETFQDSGRLMSSRFGFRGSEDLGGGLRANFVLESGLNLTTGTSTSPTAFFNRQSLLGLSSTSAGSFTLGRQYTPIYDHLILLSGAPTFGVAGGAVDGIANGASSAARFDNTIGGTRIDSSFKYVSPVFSGFKANAMLALDEGGARGRYVSAGLGYANGPLTLGGAFHRSDCKKTAPCNGTTVADDEMLGIGGGYDFRAAKVGVVYTRQKNAKNVRGNDADVFSVLAQVPVDLWIFSVGYQRLNDKSALDQDLRQFNLGAQYNISKRTAAYAFYTNQKVDNGGKAGMALISSSDNRQNQLSMGLRHVF